MREEDDHNHNERVNNDGISNNIANTRVSNCNTTIPVAFIDEDRPIYIDPNVLIVDSTSLNSLPIATLQNHDDNNDNNNSEDKDSYIVMVETDADLVTNISGSFMLSANHNPLTTNSQSVTSTAVPVAQGQIINNTISNDDHIAHAQAAYTIRASRALQNEDDMERNEEESIRNLIETFLSGSSTSQDLQENSLSRLSPQEREILNSSNYTPEQQIELARLATRFRNENNSTTDHYAVSAMNRINAEERRDNPPDDHFTLACFSLIFCLPCLPIALCSVYESCQVSIMHQDGRYSASKIASTRAKILAMIAIALGGIWYLIILGTEVEEEEK